MSDPSRLDDSARRQLRFSLFLQSFAALMMGGALVVRAGSIGWDGITGLLAVALLVILGAAAWTINRLRSG